jgi:hypothetical protein
MGSATPALKGSFRAYLSSRSCRPPADAVLEPEADAYFEGGTNRGGNPDLKVKFASSRSLSTFRRIHMRFDLSSLADDVAAAKIVLRNLDPGGIGIFQVEFVENDTWNEDTIRNSNAPAGSTIMRTYVDGRSDLEIDVSSVIRQEIEGDGKLSIRIIGVGDYGAVPTHGSKENPDPLARPALMVDYPNPVCWNGGTGSWGDATQWSTDEGATQPNPADAPGAFDDVMFNITVYSAASYTTTSITVNGGGQHQSDGIRAQRQSRHFRHGYPARPST